MDSYRWWQTGIIYQIYPRSFMDSNGDGVGDLAGITHRLDYLHALGVDAIWISPCYPSPMVDFGYDVTDHTAVDPLFGTLADFDTLVAHAHARAIRVLVDFVPNHTSDQHPWFTASRSDTGNPMRDWYLWGDPAPGGGPPTNWRSMFGGPAWTLNQATGQYYYHAYLPQQPDLNWRNPQVRQAQFDVMRFWLRRGVDGFRVDACRQLVKDSRLRDNPPNPDYHPGLPPYEALQPIYTTERPELLDIFAGMRRTLDEQRGDRDGVLLGELYLPVERIARYYGDGGNGLHLPANMSLLSVPYRTEEIGALLLRYEAALPDYAWPNWVLGNHDRSRIATRVGAAQARVAAMLLLTLRGTPTMYYGDEIGMTDVPVPDHLARDPYALRVPGLGVGRDPERAPMQWAPGPHGGFCPPDAAPWLPLSPATAVVNVECQERDPNSMLALYRRLIRLRRAEPALSVGAITLLEASGDLLVYRRSHGGRGLLVALNLGHQPRAWPGPASGAVVLGTHPDRAGDRIGDVVTLRGDEGVIIVED